MSGEAECSKNGSSKALPFTVTSSITSQTGSREKLYMLFQYSGASHEHHFTCSYKAKSCYGRFNHDEKTGYMRLTQDLLIYTKSNTDLGSCKFKAR